VNSQRQTFRNPRSAQSPVFGLPYRKIDLLSAAVNGKRRTANSFGIGGAPAGQAVLTGCLSAAPQRFVTVQTAFAPSPASKYRSALILSSALTLVQPLARSCCNPAGGPGLPACRGIRRALNASQSLLATYLNRQRQRRAQLGAGHAPPPARPPSSSSPSLKRTPKLCWSPNQPASWSAAARRSFLCLAPPSIGMPVPPPDLVVLRSPRERNSSRASVFPVVTQTRRAWE